MLFHECGRISDEYLAAIIDPWPKNSPSFEGQYISFSNAAFEPKPVQKPHLPIWVGGDAEPEFKGVPFEVSYGLGTSRVCEGHKATHDRSGRVGMAAQEIVDRLGWLRQLGVTSSAAPIPAVRGIGEYLDHAQWVVDEIKPKVP